MGRFDGSPVAVLDHDGLASRLDLLVDRHHVGLAAAAIKFPRVEPEVDQRLDVALDLLLALRRVDATGLVAVIGAVAVVAVCGRMCQVSRSALGTAQAAAIAAAELLLQRGATAAAAVRYLHQPEVSLRLWAWSAIALRSGNTSWFTIGLPSLSW